MSLPNEETTACPIILELSRHLRANNKSGINTCLAQLKNDSLRCRDFTDQGGLRIIVKLLRSQNYATLNMSLSILANACVSADARYKLRDSKIQDNVVLIMKSPKPDASVLCRACRLIGNLSECSWHAQSLCNAGVIKPLVAILQLKTNRQTYLMAVRAVRNIWSTWNGSRDKFLEAEAVRFIAQLFVMAREQCDIDSKYNELMEVCLKTMCAFLVIPDVRCGEQMEVDKDKQGYKCLMQCCNEGNKMAIRCLYSLCQITRCRLVLGISGIIEQLIALIKTGDSNLFKDILASLCLFCRDSVNRAKINNSGGLELIVMLLKNPDFERYHPMLLHALTHFIFCDNSMVILEKHGLIEVLVEQLKKTAVDTIGEKNDLNVNTNSNASKRRRDGTPSRKFSRTNVGRFCRLHFEGDSSPGSATSICSSPPSTPPLLHDDFMMESDVRDDDYSPVYSDTEWADNDDELQDGEADSLRSCKSLTIDAENSCDSEKAIKRTFLFFHCDYTALILLCALSFLPKPIDRLAHPTTIKSLSAYIRRTKNEKANTILTRIVRNGAYFIPLLKQGFVFEAQNLHKAEFYMQELSYVAETGGAVGQLSSMLLRGEEQLKLIVAVSIPFLIRKSRVTLKSLLHNHGGLQLIFRLLNESSHELHEQAVWSVCRLAVTLQIHPETVEKCSVTAMNDSQLHGYLLSNCENNHPQPSPTVTFELDDGTTFEACRRTLCQRSDVFSAMLEGNFCESGKRRVRLKNASREGLNTLILAATGVSYKHRSIESLLDAVLLADKFLMPDLSDMLTDSSIAKLSHENFSRAWYWARTNACRELQICCVKSFLTANMTRSQMVRAFHDFSATEAFDEFLCEIREIIAGVLCQP